MPCKACGSTSHSRTTHRDCPANFKAFLKPTDAEFCQVGTAAFAVVWEFSQAAKCVATNGNTTVCIRDIKGIDINHLSSFLASWFGPPEQRLRIEQIRELRKQTVLPPEILDTIAIFAWGPIPSCSKRVAVRNAHGAYVRWSMPVQWLQPCQAQRSYKTLNAKRSMPVRITIPKVPTDLLMQISRRSQALTELNFRSSCSKNWR